MMIKHARSMPTQYAALSVTSDVDDLFSKFERCMVLFSS